VDRVVAEVDHVVAEADHVVAEVDHVVAEVDHVVAEVDHVVAEVDRVVAEVDRVVAEVDRVVAEAARVVAEAARVVAEVNRVGAEVNRVVAAASTLIRWGKPVSGVNETGGHFGRFRRTTSIRPSPSLWRDSDRIPGGETNLSLQLSERLKSSGRASIYRWISRHCSGGNARWLFKCWNRAH